MKSTIEVSLDNHVPPNLTDDAECLNELCGNDESHIRTRNCLTNAVRTLLLFLLEVMAWPHHCMIIADVSTKEHRLSSTTELSHSQGEEEGCCLPST